MDGVQGGIRIGALAQQDDPFHHVVVIENRPVWPVGRPPDVPEPDLRPLRHRSDVLDPERSTILRFHHDALDAMHVADQPQRANVDLLQTGFHETPAGVNVVLGQLLLHLADAQVVSHQFVRVDADLILARRSPEAHHVHHVRHRFELLLQRPVLERFQLHHVISGVGAAQRVPVDLPDGAEIGPDLRL